LLGLALTIVRTPTCFPYQPIIVSSDLWSSSEKPPAAALRIAKKAGVRRGSARSGILLLTIFGCENLLSEAFKNLLLRNFIAHFLRALLRDSQAL